MIKKKLYIFLLLFFQHETSRIDIQFVILVYFPLQHKIYYINKIIG